MKTAHKRIVSLFLLLMIFQGLMPHPGAEAKPMPLIQEAGMLSLPDGRAGQAYEYQLQTEGGLAPLTWRVTAGEIPPGIQLDRSGNLKGVPTVPRRQAYSFVVEVSDSSPVPQKFAQPLLLAIQAAPLRMVKSPTRLKIVQSPTAPSDSPETAAPVGPSVEVLSHKVEKDRPASEPKEPGLTWPYMASGATRSELKSDAPLIRDSQGDGSEKKEPKYENNPDPSGLQAVQALNPAYFVKVYEVPKSRSASFQRNTTIEKYGDGAQVYGKLIYDGKTAGLNNSRLTADAGSTIVVVPDVEGRNIAFNTIYMAAELASGDTKQNLEVINYSEVGTAPSADAFLIGASFQSAKDTIDMLITLQRRATDVLKYTLRLHSEGEIADTELLRIQNIDLQADKTNLFDRAREGFDQYAPEIESISNYLVSQSNRNITERIANNLFHLNRDTLIAIAKQFSADVALLKSTNTVDRDAATRRLLVRTIQVYKDFKAARADILYMAGTGAPNTPREPERMVHIEKLREIRSRIAGLDPQANKSLIEGLRKDLETEARNLYAYDRSAEAITNLRQTKFPVGWVSLDEARAKDGDTLKLTVRVQNPANAGTGNKVPFYITVKKYGAKLHWASSFVFIKRLNITPEDLAPDANGNALSDVNFAPSPGVSYGVTFFKRGDDGGSKFLRLLAPTIGMNVSFMNFKDPGFDLSTNMFTNTKGTDVQVGAGPIISLFDNKLHFTQGWNLNVDQKRRYWGIGFGFVEFAKELGKYIKSQ